jgi:hypothetical protein
MAMYSFVPPFREAKFCGVPSCVFDKLGCAADEESLRNTGLMTTLSCDENTGNFPVYNTSSLNCFRYFFMKMLGS